MWLVQRGQAVVAAELRLHFGCDLHGGGESFAAMHHTVRYRTQGGQTRCAAQQPLQALQGSVKRVMGRGGQCFLLRVALHGPAETGLALRLQAFKCAAQQGLANARTLHRVHRKLERGRTGVDREDG